MDEKASRFQLYVTENLEGFSKCEKKAIGAIWKHSF